MGSRGKKHGEAQWEQDQYKAMDAKRAAWKSKTHTSILSRWQNDEQYRNSQLDLGGTETYCLYLDNLTTIDIFHNAPYLQRSRYENTITMKSSDPNHQSGPMWKREDYRLPHSDIQELGTQHVKFVEDTPSALSLPPKVL